MAEIKKYAIALIVSFFSIEILCLIIVMIIGVGPFQDSNYTRYRASGYYCFGNRPYEKFNGFDGFDDNTYKPSELPLIADKYGLISDMPILLGKQKDVIKIIVRGGSAMFGSLQTNWVAVSPTYPRGEYSFKSSIAGILQDELQQKFPDKKIQVINAAVVQHSFYQNYAMYVSLLHFFKPDIIVSMDGYNDLISVYSGDCYTQSEEMTDEFIKIEAEKRSKHFPFSLFLANYIIEKFSIRKTPVTMTGKDEFNESFYINEEQQSDYHKIEKHFADNSKELFWIIDAYSSTLIRDSVFPVVCLQPLLGRKDIQKPLTKLEKNLLEATQKKGIIGLIEKYYWGMYFASMTDSIMKKNGGAFLDLGQAIANRMDGEQEAFMDYCHLTYSANKVVATEIAQLISKQIKLSNYESKE